MRERLDCAILGFGGLAEWHGEVGGVHAKGRLYLHLVEQPANAEGNVRVLAQMATHLQRFDACLLSVGHENLSWVRQALMLARLQLRTPVIGLMRNLKAPAIDDLYNLGMADFVREPLCIEEIRIRTERLLDQRRAASASRYADHVVARPGALQDNGLCYRVADGDHGGTVLKQASPVVADQIQIKMPDSDAAQRADDLALEAFARACASQCATSSDSFSIAKRRVIQCFESNYLHASLARSSGNIAQAARGAKKHRRAFWALMRKHNIDATPYRKVMPPKR